jgi:transposase
MHELPPAAPVTGWRLATRLPRDHYVRVDSNDYSVHPSVIGRTVEIAAGLEEVRVTCQGNQVARHPRCWAAHQTITDPGHAAAAAQLRQARRMAAGRPADTAVQQRALSDYDRILGTSDQGAA